MVDVEVTSVEVPAMSTIGYGTGVRLDTGADVSFVGDHRPMRDLLYALATGENPIATVPVYALFGGAT